MGFRVLNDSSGSGREKENPAVNVYRRLILVEERLRELKIKVFLDWGFSSSRRGRQCL